MTELRADCSRCAGLCCVVPAFSASADFAIDKPAGEPCPNLGPGFRCGIHDRLRPEGFPGCAAYDCFGAGQRVTQVTFGRQDWRTTPSIAAQMFRAFDVVRQLHQMLWYLTEAMALPAARTMRDELGAALQETERLAQQGSDGLLTFDMASLRPGVHALLLRASELARSDGGSPGVDRSGADLVGADLRGADFARANLRAALLVGADLRGADLRGADLMGTDLRGAELTGADLTGSIYLTQSQLDSARH